MTARAILLGLIVAVALACLGYMNDIWLGFPSIGGNLMPTYAFGLLCLAALVVNPLLRLTGIGRLPLARGELVMFLGLVLMGSVIGGSGLLWVFPHPVITPFQEMAKSSRWAAMLPYVPREMLVDTTINSEVVNSYLHGLGRQGQAISPLAVPWRAWGATLGFWFSVLGLNFVIGLAGAVVVYRQWSQREHLSFPVAAVTSELLEPPQPGRLVGRIFGDRLFWLGFAVAFGILLVNGYQAWRPGFVSIPTGIDFTAFQEVLGPVAKVPWVNILQVKFYFAAVGLAYFLTTEASFSLGLSGWLYALPAAALLAAGVKLESDVLEGGLPAFMYFGAYVGLALMVLYLGRRYYAALLGRSFGLGGRARDAQAFDRGRDGRDTAEVLPREVWACRIMLAASAVLVGLLWHVGLHPLLAAAFVLLCGGYFLMIGRINAATGLFIIQPFWQPVAVLLAVFGPLALGPQAIVILAMLCVVVTIDPRIAAVPLALNVLKLGESQPALPGQQHDRRPLRVGGATAWMGVGIVLAMVVAVPATVYLMYDKGVAGVDSGGTHWALDVAKMPMEMLERATNELNASGVLAAAQEPTNLWRLLGQARPRQYFFAAAGVGLALVLACSWLRLRFPRWPLHPVLFLVWGSRWTTEFAPSFLLAWLIKTQVMRFGGQSGYRRARPFFIGLMAGEFLAGLLWGLVGVGFYLFTGDKGPYFKVRP